MATSVRCEAQMTADTVKFRGKGVSGTATAGATSNIDLKMDGEARLLDGLELLLKDHAGGDTLKLQVVDVDNILGYGAGVVLDEFGTDWNVDDTVRKQGVWRLPYSAEVISGLYIRIRYTSTGGTNVNVRCNYFLHKPLC